MERSWCRWILKNKFLSIKRAGAGFLSVERDNEPSIKLSLKMVVCMSVALNLKVNKQMFIKSIYNFEFAKELLYMIKKLQVFWQIIPTRQ